MTTDAVTIRALQRHEWPEAMALAARAFADEPFMAEIFGAEPVRRFDGAVRLFGASGWREADRQLGAFVAGVMVGLCVASPPGHCRICTAVDPATPPDDPYLAVEWEFELNVQQAHSDQGTHGWITKVVVDQVLRGAGIGRRLIAAAVAEIAAAGAPTLLECQPHREAFYESCGFRQVRTFPDPAGPPALLMRTATG